MPWLPCLFLLEIRILKRKLRILYLGNKLSAHGRTPTGIDALGPMLEQEGYTLYYSSDKLNKVQRLKDMLRTIRKRKNDVDIVLIDTYSTMAFHYAWICGWVCRRLGLKYIPILHGGDMPERLRRSPGLCNIFFGKSFANIVVSGYLQKHMQQKGYSCTLIPNSISSGDYTFRKRNELKPNLLWVRAFHKTYNPDMGIELVDKLVQQYPQVHLTMVGPEVDGSMAVAKTYTAQKGLDKHITFTGKLSKQEWTSLAQEADIFINTTNYDNLPVSVIEAMALGLPVVSTNVGGLPFLIKDSKTGFLVEPDDTPGMARAIKTLLNDSELAESMSVSARKHAEEFDWDFIKEKWHLLFSNIVSS